MQRPCVFVTLILFFFVNTYLESHAKIMQCVQLSDVKLWKSCLLGFHTFVSPPL